MVSVVCMELWGSILKERGQEQSEVEKSFGDSTRPPKVKPLNHKGKKLRYRIERGILGIYSKPNKDSGSRKRLRIEPDQELHVILFLLKG